MRRRLHAVLQHLLLLVAVALAGWLSVHWQWRGDFSHGQRASLSPASVDVLAAQRKPVTGEKEREILFGERQLKQH